MQKVLIVDDEKNMLFALERILKGKTGDIEILKAHVFMTVQYG
jgi:YesN/AraC family two-component response regulator